MDTAVPGVEVEALLQPRASPSSSMDQHIHLPTHIQAVPLACWGPWVFPAPIPGLQSGSWGSLSGLSLLDCLTLLLVGPEHYPH